MSDKATTFNVAKAYGVPDIAGVLLSGGVDSATALYEANDLKNNSGFLYAISFDYGQRHSKELLCAAKLAEEVKAKHVILSLQGIVPKTTLTDSDAHIPDVSYSELKGVSPTYVPFRNGLMISAAASFLAGTLEQLIAQGDLPVDAVAHLYAGMHAEDAAAFAYPDCTPEFAGSMANAIWMGTYGKVRLITPFIYSSKAAITLHGHHLGVPYDKTWSCYKGGEKHCGVCPTCRARREAFITARVDDPTEYAA